MSTPIKIIEAPHQIKGETPLQTKEVISLQIKEVNENQINPSDDLEEFVEELLKEDNNYFSDKRNEAYQEIPVTKILQEDKSLKKKETKKYSDEQTGRRDENDSKKKTIINFKKNSILKPHKTDELKSIGNEQVKKKKK